MKHFEDAGQGRLQVTLERRKGEDSEEHGRTKGQIIETVGNGGQDGPIGGDGKVLSFGNGHLSFGHGHRHGQEHECAHLSSVAAPLGA